MKEQEIKDKIEILLDNSMNFRDKTYDRNVIDEIYDLFMNQFLNPLGKDKKIIADSVRDGIPIFVFTAKDANSTTPLYAYMGKCMDKCTKEHVRGILDRLSEFLKYQNEHPEKVKLPD